MNWTLLSGFSCWNSVFNVAALLGTTANKVDARFEGMADEFSGSRLANATCATHYGSSIMNWTKEYVCGIPTEDAH